MKYNWSESRKWAMMVWERLAGTQLVGGNVENLEKDGGGAARSVESAVQVS